MSPFKKYRHILFEGYSTAESLQEFTLSLYNGATTRFRADRLANYDAEHFRIFTELAASYHANREEDEDFMAVCREMWAQRKQWGREHLAEVEKHRMIDPSAYEGGEREWREQMEWLNKTTLRHREMGWIEEG